MNVCRPNKLSKFRGRRFLSIAAAFALLSTAGRTQQRYTVDPAASEAHFKLGASDHPVEGTFHVTSGEFTLDPGTGVMSGMVTVDASSGESGNKSRDKKMTSAQLKAQTYSTITFAPAKFTGQLKDSGDSTGAVDGTFTLVGQPHPISLPVNVHIEGDHFTATGAFIVPFVNWGVKDPSFMFLKVDKEVKIEMKLAGKVTK